jgi:hypothetical protein
MQRNAMSPPPNYSMATGNEELALSVTGNRREAQDFLEPQWLKVNGSRQDIAVDV